MKKPYLKPVSIVYALTYEAILLTGTNLHTSGGTQSNATEDLNQMQNLLRGHLILIGNNRMSY